MNPDTLPDLINTRLGDIENTEGEIDAIDAPTGIVDAAPVPILLDQINVDNTIANIIDTEENEKEAQK